MLETQPQPADAMHQPVTIFGKAWVGLSQEGLLLLPPTSGQEAGLSTQAHQCASDTRYTATNPTQALRVSRPLHIWSTPRSYDTFTLPSSWQKVMRRGNQSGNKGDFT